LKVAGGGEVNTLVNRSRQRGERKEKQKKKRKMENKKKITCGGKRKFSATVGGRWGQMGAGESKQKWMGERKKSSVRTKKGRKKTYLVVDIFVDASASSLARSAEVLLWHDIS
jgi:hypothetical protein